MQSRSSNEQQRARGGDGRTGCGAAAALPTSTDENDLDDDLSSPPKPPATAPHAALAILLRKAAAEAVVVSNEESKGKNSKTIDLEATLALGRLALVLSTSSSSSSASASQREEYLPLFIAALAASLARRALGAALVQVCRKARTQDGVVDGNSIAAEARELLDGGAPLEFATEHGDTPLTVAPNSVLCLFSASWPQRAHTGIWNASEA